MYYNPKYLKSNNKGLLLSSYRKVEDLTNWRRCLKEVDREIHRFARAFSDGDDQEKTVINHETDAYAVLATCKNKLQKTKDNINTKIKNDGDNARYDQLFKNNILYTKRNMLSLYAFAVCTTNKPP